jgi:hypothetical protein
MKIKMGTARVTLLIPVFGIVMKFPNPGTVFAGIKEFFILFFTNTGLLGFVCLPALIIIPPKDR